MTTALFGLAPYAEAKQCVWNKAGFVLQVDWYHNADVKFDKSSNQPKLRKNATPAQTYSYTLGFGGCQKSSEQMWAVLSVRGASWVKTGLSIGAVTATAVGTGVVGAVVCAGTAGAGCPAAAAGVGAAVAGVSQAAAEFIPDPVGLNNKPGVFAIEVPSNATWVYVKGTVWNPSMYDGAQIKANDQRRLNTLRSRAMDTVAAAYSESGCHLLRKHRLPRGRNDFDQLEPATPQMDRTIRPVRRLLRSWSDSHLGSG